MGPAQRRSCSLSATGTARAHDSPTSLRCTCRSDSARNGAVHCPGWPGAGVRTLRGSSRGPSHCPTVGASCRPWRRRLRNPRSPRASAAPAFPGTSGNGSRGASAGDAEQTASGVVVRVAQARTDFPVDVLALPCAPAAEHHRHRRIGDEAVADVGPDGVHPERRVDVAVVDGLVDDVASEILLEDASVLPVQLVVEAQEDLVSGRWH